MPQALYLDAARMGRMTPSTQRALQAFVRLAGEKGCTLYFERFLKDGYRPGRDPEDLKVWQGIRELKQTLSAVAGAAVDSPLTLLAGRAANLVRMAARFLFRHCKCVLVTDLTWPSYFRTLLREARRASRTIVSVPCRDMIFGDRATPQEICSRITSAADATGCRGALLPHVSHDGIRLPVEDLCRPFSAQGVHCVLDGAQALAHVPVNLSTSPCDFYIGGCHKWLGAYLPLGVGFCPRRKSPFPDKLPRIDDPLLAFVRRLESGTENRFSETVNVAPLFSCRAALQDLGNVAEDLTARRMNAERLIEVLDYRWTPIQPHQGFRSGILLLKAAHPDLPDNIRSLFLSSGIALTVYEQGVLRLSLPKVLWTPDELARIARTFYNIGRRLHAVPQHFHAAIRLRQVCSRDHASSTTPTIV
jgi:hypothetical protein